jgi:hypothetical protein
MVLRTCQAVQDALRHRFMEVLHTGDPASETSASAARALGFDPDAAFQAVCTPVASWPEDGTRCRTHSARFMAWCSACRGSGGCHSHSLPFADVCDREGCDGVALLLDVESNTVGQRM